MNGPISSRGDSCAIARVPSDFGVAYMEARSCCFALVFLSLTFSQSTFSACEDAHFLGKLEHRCPHCHALHWIGECLANSSMSKPLFGSCCLKGKVQLEFVDPLPPELYWYYVADHDDAKEFRSHIRRYNKAFAFTSSGGSFRLDGRVLDGRGPPCYKIQGELFHQIGPVLPENPQAPLYSQLYIYDPTDALQHRKSNNPQTRSETMAFLQMLMLHCNPFVDTYVQADELMRSTSIPEYHLKLDFLLASDRRRYNLPSSQHELAAIIPGDVDSCVNSREVILRTRGGALMRITELHPAYIALQFPLLAPTGQRSWDDSMRYSFLPSQKVGVRTRQFVTFDEFLKYHLHIRPLDVESDHYYLAGWLFQEFVVDMWAAVEHSRLEWIRYNQGGIRAELYCGLIDALREGLHLSSIGQKVILPSSFTSGPRSMQKNMQDALALLRIFKGSDLFITFTANPAWPEITDALLHGQSANDRPDIVARVFHLKVEALLEDIMKRNIFGEAVGHVYTIEYQKRGLPHIHLIVFLHSDARLSSPERVDSFISTEFPDEVTQPLLHDLVKTHMVHGPCGAANYSPCLNDKNQCSKNFPKPFLAETDMSSDSYVKTRRRDNGQSYIVRGVAVDNRSVISYSPFLLSRYRAHINVECTSGFNAIKYIYKASTLHHALL
jgi:hypothetical protein